MEMNRFKKFTIILFFLLITACGGGNTINDLKTLEQKALEIPPNFDLKPPSDNTDELDENVSANEDQNSDIENILGSQENGVEEELNKDGELLDILIGDTSN